VSTPARGFSPPSPSPPPGAYSQKGDRNNFTYLGKLQKKHETYHIEKKQYKKSY
jgi:hypothetical protein